MRIAIFTDTFSPDVNGVSTTLANYVNYLDQSEHIFHVFTPSCDSNQPIYIHPLLSIRFFLYPEYQIHLPNFAQIKQALKLFEPDIIHVVTPFTIGLYGIKYAQKHQIPLVGSYHTNFDQYLNYYHLRFLSPAVWKYLHRVHQPMERIFTPSLDTLNYLQRKGFTNLRLWERGVDITTFRPIGHDQNQQLRKKYKINEPFILSYVGRLSPEKNIDCLLEIIKSIPERLQNNVHWLMVGDGPVKTQLEQLDFPNLTCTGYLHGQDLADTYAISDLFIFPSATETFGNVVLESLASGTPVIGANCGGVKYLLEDQKHGVTCDPNQPDQFVQSIVDLLTNPIKRSEMAIAARNFACKKSWKRVFDQLIDDYDEVLDEQRHLMKQA